LGLNVQVSNIGTGGDFVVLVTQNGVVFSFGNNNAGQLGLGDLVNRNSP